MKSTEGKQQIFKVEIDSHGDFKIVEIPVTSYLKVRGKKEPPIDKDSKKQIKTQLVPTIVGTNKKPVERPIIRSKSTKSIETKKDEKKKIRKKVSVQRIEAYVKIVSPDDKIVDENAFLCYIKMHLLKKYPDKYLEILKKRKIMVPCGGGKLKFNERW